jgi:hypothetical protein
MFFRNFICCNHDKSTEQANTVDIASTNPFSSKSLSITTDKQPRSSKKNAFTFCNTIRTQKTEESLNDLSLISVQSNQSNNSLFSIVNKLPLSPKQTERNSNRGVNETPTFKIPTSRRNKIKTSCFNPLSHNNNNKNNNTIKNNNKSISVKSFQFSYCDEE